MRKLLKVKLNVFINIIYSLLIFIIGIIVMNYPSLGMLSPIYFVSIMFFILSFLSTLAYFLGRKNNDYELIIISLINVLIASYMFICQNGDAPIILGTGVLLFTLLNVLIKGYYTYEYKKEKKYIWSVKLLSSILLFLIGTLTTVNLYNNLSVITIMFGYYFITYGLINLIEPSFEYLVQIGYFKNLIKEINKEK